MITGKLNFKVSVILTLFNSRKFYKRALDSALNQTFTDIEIVITDDGSVDETYSELIPFITGNEKIKYLYHSNRGHALSLNSGIMISGGEYITFLDADDFWEPDFLQEMVSFMKSEKAELAYCTYARCDENLQPKIADFEADIDVTFDNLLKTCRLSLLASMYDSERVGKEFFPEGSKREDHVMWLNLLKKIPYGKPLKKTLAKYRMREGSVSRNKTNIMKDQYLVYKEHMNFSTLKSLYYTANWAFNGFKKYSKIFN